MGTVRTHTPEKLVIGVLTSLPDAAGEIADAVRGAWGPVDFQSGPIPFTWSAYYDAEMGHPLLRWFLTLQELVDPASLAAVKAGSNALEERWRRDGRRAVNLDPGLLALSRFVLATTKENAHRVPLSGGIFAEVTLLYGRGGFRPVEWTYPDYRSPQYLEVLDGIRARYKEQLRRSCPT